MGEKIIRLDKNGFVKVGDTSFNPKRIKDDIVLVDKKADGINAKADVIDKKVITADERITTTKAELIKQSDLDREHASVKAATIAAAEFEKLAENQRNITDGSGIIFGNNKRNKGVNGLWVNKTLDYKEIIQHNYNGEFPVYNVHGVNIHLIGTQTGTANQNAFHMPSVARGRVLDYARDTAFKMIAGDEYIYNDMYTTIENGDLSNDLDHIFYDREDIVAEVVNNKLKLEVDGDGKTHCSWKAHTIPGLIYDFVFTYDATDFETPTLAVYDNINNEWILQKIKYKSGDKNTMKISFTAKSSISSVYVLSDDSSPTGTLYVSNVRCNLKAPMSITSTKDIANGSDIIADSNGIVVNGFTSGRLDLGLLEVWREKIADKDVAYPYGNVGFRGNVVLGKDNKPVGIEKLEPVTFERYANLGQWETEAKSSMGYVWSKLSIADKLKFVSDPRNNVYLKNNELYQVRYRIRIIKGQGSRFTVGEDQYINYDYAMRTSNDNRLGHIGNSVSVGDFYDFPNGLSKPKQKYIHNLSSYNEYPHKQLGEYGSDDYTEEEVIGIPLFKVQRRNSGIYHPQFNTNGSAKYKLDDAAVNWNEIPEGVIRSIADCFEEVNVATVDPENPDKISDLTTIKDDGYLPTGTFASKICGNPDNEYFDVIYDDNIKDLRINSVCPESQTMINEAMHTIKFGKANTMSEVETTIASVGFTRYWCDEYHGSAVINFNHNGIPVLPFIPSLTTQKNVREDVYLKFTSGNASYMDYGYGTGIVKLRYSYLHNTTRGFRVYSDDNKNLFSDPGTRFELGDKCYLIYSDKYKDARSLPKFTNRNLFNVYETFEPKTYTTGLMCEYFNNKLTLDERVKYTAASSEDQNVYIDINTYVKADDVYYRSKTDRGVINIDPEDEDFTATENWAKMGEDGSRGGIPREWLTNGTPGVEMYNVEYDKEADEYGSKYLKHNNRIKTVRQVFVSDNNGKFIEFKHQRKNEINRPESMSYYMDSVKYRINSTVVNYGDSYGVMGYDSADEMVSFATVIIFYTKYNNPLVPGLNTDIIADEGGVRVTGDDMNNNTGVAILTDNIMYAPSVGNLYDNSNLYNIDIANRTASNVMNSNYKLKHTKIELLSSQDNTQLKYTNHLVKTRGLSTLNVWYNELITSRNIDDVVYYDSGYEAKQFQFGNKGNKIFEDANNSYNNLAKDMPVGVKKYLEIYLEDVDFVGSVEVYANNPGTDDDDFTLLTDSIEKYVVWSSGNNLVVRIPIYGGTLGRVKLVSTNSEGVYVSWLRVIKAASDDITWDPYVLRVKDDNEFIISSTLAMVKDSYGTLKQAGLVSMRLPYFIK